MGVIECLPSSTPRLFEVLTVAASCRRRSLALSRWLSVEEFDTGDQLTGG
jgi:hypothetical protein